MGLATSVADYLWLVEGFAAVAGGNFWSVIEG